MRCSEFLLENRHQNQSLDLSKKLKKAMASAEAYSILDSDPATAGSTWQAGGCGVLAYALHQYLPESTLVDIVNTKTNLTEHVAVEYQNRIYDANGSAPSAAYVDQYRKQENIRDEVKLVPHNANRTQLSEIPIEPQLINATYEYLTQRL